MTNYSPSTLFLKELHDRLEVLAIPIYFHLPNPDVLEPFVVIGSNSSDTSKTAQTGAIIEDIKCHYIQIVKALCRWIANLYPL